MNKQINNTSQTRFSSDLPAIDCLFEYNAYGEDMEEIFQLGPEDFFVEINDVNEN